jgi:hypothetical protein
MEEETLLIVPKCETIRNAFTGEIKFYNLMVTNKRLAGAKIGRAVWGFSSGNYDLEKSRLDIGKYAGKSIEEIIALDKNNWAIPFSGFAKIKFRKALGSPELYGIDFKLNKEGKKLPHHSSVPKWLFFDRKYQDELQATLKNLAGNIVKT